VVTEAILYMQVTSVNNMLNGAAKITSFDTDLGSVVFCLTSTFFTVFGTPLAMLKHSWLKLTVVAAMRSVEVPGVHAANLAWAI